ncbi:hypothetical protein ONP73_17650 [Salmonella enterica subsp. enterica serovar Lille]|uniref:hypothetical protein n=1 Tax=Salmonella enterica TaxID=28901 RepID=UPI000A7B6E0E|nr:hypothetical protein [Salmonella enterica]MEA5714097.1 hypothetical protein [Salmonella enterica subsp. enterica serovar Lille]MEA5974161.1 hypothetical protein [Salmonella enterica subsp. enterica serovar Lille]MEA6015158.1 hypothetical protein [Salmonella enterica subsp. enterica serovar Lille]MEA6042549.1 hypothetical protein [Salmonella enterica subsp. enterica serovar Lille]MEA6499274.1 hypothetical protein [Salmonella enterica subsp. enterica serovar Lille]
MTIYITELITGLLVIAGLFIWGEGSVSDWQIPIIILAGASLVAGFILLKKHKDRDQKVEVLYGYPANSTTWLTIYHYRKSGRWVFEWDDLFAEKRPKSWGDISECMMFEERKSGATREEFNEAWRRLSERGYQ